jgi:hypothetical protein
MTEYASIEDLTADRVTGIEEDYELPGVGTILIRPLARGEFLAAQKRFGDDMEKQEQFILSRCVVKPEGVTEAVVARWQKSSNIGEINALAMHINKMSGLGKGADKSSMD